jgi:hypothetical protein
MGKAVHTIFAILVLAGASFAVSVSVSSPTPNATVGSPVTIAALASSSYPITGWHIYVDGRDAYVGGASQAISAPVSMAAGTHQLIVRAWDSTGAYGSYNLQLTVGSAAAAPVGGSATVSVGVLSPANYATVGSPVTFTASAGSGYPITGWRIYVDGISVYTAGATSTISAPVAVSGGTHQVVVRAWNSTGAFGSQNLTINVGGGATAQTAVTQPAGTAPDGGPVAPPNAVVYSRLEEASGWGNCRSAACSGSDSPASYWMAQYQTTPSLDGSSTQFYMSGSAWADVLWYKHVNPIPTATHYLMDFWVKPNADTLTHTEALEFDFVQIINGHKFDVSNQMHYSGTPHWDTWDGLNLRWIHTNIPCPKLDPNKWHHVKIYAERTATQTHNISYTVDGVTYPVPAQYAWHDTRSSGTATTQNVQVQMDINGNAGTSSEYIDKLTLYLW